ncbi:MAG: MFS transporter [Trueperaceae bacterium]
MTTPLPKAFIFTGFLIFLTMGALFASTGALFPGLQQRFSLSESEVGFLSTIMSVGGMVGFLGLGVLEDQLKLRRRLLVACVFAVSGLLGLAFAPLWWLTLAGSFITGIGTAMLNAEVNATFAKSFGKRSPMIVNLGGAIFGSGAVLGPLLVSFNPTNPQPLFLSLAAIIILTLVLFSIVRLPLVAPQNSERGNFPITLLSFFIVIFLLQTSIEVIVNSWAATHLIALGSSPEVAARAVAVFWAMVTLSRFLTTPLSLYVKPAILILVSFALTLVFALLATTSLTLPAYILIGLAVGSLFPLQIAWMGQLLPHAKGATAYALTGASVGAAVFPPLGGKLIEVSSVSSIPTLLVTLALLGFISVLALYIYSSKQQREKRRFCKTHLDAKKLSATSCEEEFLADG